MMYSMLKNTELNLKKITVKAAAIILLLAASLTLLVGCGGGKRKITPKSRLFFGFLTPSVPFTITPAAARGILSRLISTLKTGWIITTGSLTYTTSTRV